MGYRKLLLLKNFQKDEDDVACPKICDVPCTGCKMEKDTVVYPVLAPSPPSSSGNHATSVLLLVSCLLGFSFLIVSYLVITKYRMRVRNSRRRNSESLDGDSFREDFLDENHGPVVDHPIWLIRTVGLTQSVIDSISIVGYKKGEGLVEGSDCAVCLTEFEEDESLRLLPKCSHAFHVQCIDTWLRAHKNCPVCRAPVVAGDGSASAVNPEETSSDDLGHEGDSEVESLNDIEEEEGGTSGVLVENGSTISHSNEETNNENEIRGKNSGFVRHERGKRVRGKSEFVEHRVTMVADEKLEPMRRSISMDSGSASLIYTEMRNKSQVKDEVPSDLNMAIEMQQSSGSRSSNIYSKLVKSSSIVRSLQNVPSSLKRSFSSGGRNSLMITEKPQS